MLLACLFVCLFVCFYFYYLYLQFAFVCLYIIALDPRRSAALHIQGGLHHYVVAAGSS